MAFIPSLSIFSLDYYGFVPIAITKTALIIKGRLEVSYNLKRNCVLILLAGLILFTTLQPSVVGDFLRLSLFDAL